MDCDVSMAHEPPVRKISMTCLLSDPSTFTGGDLEFMEKNKMLYFYNNNVSAQFYQASSGTC